MATAPSPSWGSARGDHSRFLDPVNDVSAYEHHVQDARAAFDDIYQGYARLGRLDIFDKITPTEGGKNGPKATDDLERLR